MDAYAGYYLDNKKLRESSSGGAASYLSEKIIQEGGIVYGAAYTADFQRIEYGCAETIEELANFKGSKYAYVHKHYVRNGKKVSVYENAVCELKRGRKVLFIGLGCDVGALKRLAERSSVDTDRLFTVELLCGGITDDIVHEQYICNLEKIYKSKIVAFSVRYKRDGWTPLYLYARFESGKEYTVPFYDTEYGFAFSSYKKKSCYSCGMKNRNHPGDLLVADFWGCRPGMETYNKDGVSLLLVQTPRGDELLKYIDEKEFFWRKVDEAYALNNNPRYYTCREQDSKWDRFDNIIKQRGLQKAVQECKGIKMPERFKKLEMNEIVLWGTGECFRQYVSFVRELFCVNCVVDSDENKWGKELEQGLICHSPETLRNKKNALVLIMVKDIGVAFQIANKLMDMGVLCFDYIGNWLLYAESDSFSKS